MKKLILVGVVTFACGAALAALLVANPFGWHWLGAQATSMQAVSDQHVDGELWTCSMHPQVLQDEPGLCPICQMRLVPVRANEPSFPAGGRTIKYWQAPMDPTYIRDEPGKSPMGMDLIPVYEDEVPAADGLVRIDPTFVQNIGVQTEPVRREDIPFTIRAPATLRYDDRRIAWVNTKYEGWIERVHVNYVGESVVRGQPLFEIYSPQLVTTQQEYLRAIDYSERLGQGQYPDVAERAASLVASARQRLAYWDISNEQIEELERTREPTRTLAVVSNVTGIVIEKMGETLEGMFVRAGMNLYQIADVSTMWADVEVFESQVPWLRVGQRAVVELPHEPGRPVTGRVRYLLPFFDAKSRTMKATIELANPGGRLRAEMYANVTLAVPAAENVLTVPEEAVIQSGRRNVIVVDRGNGAFQVVEAVLGRNGSGRWEVISGVDEGDRVVVSAQFLIDSESSLKEAIRKVVSRPGPAAESAPDAEAPAHIH